MRALTQLALAAALVMAAVPVPPAGAATITIVNLDGAGEGLNDPTPVPSVSGNPCDTLGAQRLRALEYAAGIWADLVGSNVEIRIGARFDPLFCGGGSAVLGLAGPATAFHSFAGAPVANTWYPVALANALAGVDLDPGVDDITATFNSDVDLGCLGSSVFYYGLDASPPGTAVDFVTVALHELGHGLGFGTLVDITTGAKALGRDDTFMLNLEDHSTAKLWPVMTDAERVASAIDTGDLHWAGAAVAANSGGVVDGRDPISGHVEMYAPNPVTGSSVSHFSNDLSPDEIMEPAYTGASHDVGLAYEVMLDLGWPALQCGDGVVQSFEGCDDMNTTDGDGCSHRCAVEQCWGCTGEPSVCTPVVDGTSCDDGDACTQTDACASGTCTGSNPVVCSSADPACVAAGTCNACSGECSLGLPTCIDHFLCYQVKATSGSPKFEAESGVTLVDQFEPSITVAASKPKQLCAPADKDGGGVVDAATHLEGYGTKAATGTPKFTVQLGVHVVNQLGELFVDVKKRDMLLVPTAKSLVVDPPAPVFASHEVDHYKCYKVKISSGAPKFPAGVQVSVTDQFTPPKTFDVKKPRLLCNPVDKNGEGIKHALVHQMCYQVKPASGQPKHTPALGVFVSNQFEPPSERYDTKKEKLLCVPSLKNP